MAMVLMLPISFALEPVEGIALLVALYIGSTSGGLISAILIEIPGTPSSIATVLDEGKAGTIYLQRVCRPARKRINVEQVREYTAPDGCGHAPYACSVSVPLVIASLPLALMGAWEMWECLPKVGIYIFSQEVSFREIAF